ncbi:MAG: TadE/TadG family type IV pilus assembly protein, partial [Phycisphaerae bacterium]|nr:TadE/TadG family type IV pilus assembly protein [Phycisphaerae bacterium]
MANARISRWLGWSLAAAVASAAVALWVLAAQRHDFIGRAVSSPLFVRCGLIAAGCALTLALLVAYLCRAGRRSEGPGARTPRLAADEGGTAMVEFALVFPVALAVMLILIQAMLMMTGTLIVNYAAY